MANILQQIQSLVQRGEVMISDHGYDELASDDILVADVLASVNSAEAVEEYPEYFKGPCVLALQRDRAGPPIHVLWGIPAEATSPAVVVTAYRPDPKRWTDGFTKRKL